jgi:hypothetical protein
MQCCGPGSGIQCLFDPCIQDSGFEIGFFFRIPDPGSRILDPKAIISRALDNFGVKRTPILCKLAHIFFFTSSKIR